MKRRAFLPGVFLLLVAADFAALAVEISVPSTDLWANTGFHVEKGRHYRIAVKNMEDVRDSAIPVRDLNGWPSPLAKILYAPVFWTRRRPLEPWFSVIATVDHRHPRRLRADRDYVAPASGLLVCYFNDAPFAYANNKGTAILTIAPTPGVPHTDK